MTYKVGDIIFIWDNDKTPLGNLDYKGTRQRNVRVAAPSYYRVVGRTIGRPIKLQIRKLDEVNHKLIDNSRYLYFIKEADVQTIT